MKKLMLGASFLVSILSNPAHAGFQFNAPDKAEAKPVISDGGLLPMETFMPAVPSQTVNEQAVPAQAPTAPIATSQPTMAQQPSAPIALSEPTAPAAPRMNEPTSQMPVATTPTIENIVTIASLDQPAVGFAQDLPLSIALNQVIPQGYTYVTDPDLDKSSLVSWTGGQAWPMVLRDMVTPLGYDAIISKTSVRIIKRPAALPIATELANTTPMELIKPVQPQVQDEPTAVETVPHQIQDPAVTPDINMAPIEAVSNTQPSVTLPVDIIESAITPDTQANTTITPDPKQQNAWIAQNGVSLKTVIESWSEIEGVDLFWSTDYDYTLKSDVKIHGSYQEAIETLLSGFSSAKPKPYGKLHPNLPDGPAVLVIETREMPKA